MNAGRTVFAQLADFLPMKEFGDCVRRYGGNRRVRTFSCLDQYFCMAFAQIARCESLREIEVCLRAMQPKLYHSGIRCKVSRSTLAKANENRDWRIYADFAQAAIRIARRLWADEDLGLDLGSAAYAFDSTTVDLCLSLFPWAKFRKSKAAVKIHTQMDLRGSMPCFARITDGKTADVKVLDQMPKEAGAFYVFDRAYIDFLRLYAFTEGCAFFVTRAKKGLDFARSSSRRVDKATGLRSDQTIVLKGPKSSRRYPAPLRKVCFFDEDRAKRLTFLTNNFLLPALTIAMLFKLRWRIETFFRWIKQNLRVKAFYGTSENAVKTQIWIAMSVYALVLIVKKELGIERSPAEILQILGVALFEKAQLTQALATTPPRNFEGACCNQLELFDF